MKKEGISDFVFRLDHCSEPAKKLRDFIRYIPGRMFFCYYKEHCEKDDYEEELDYWFKLQGKINNWLKDYTYLSDYVKSKDFWKYSTKFESYKITHALYLRSLNSQAKKLLMKIFVYESENYNLDWLNRK